MAASTVMIFSGGQTGADRAALDWAITNNFLHGGWCPQGRIAEDGPLDPCYKLSETPLPKYAQRTEWNVRDSDGTVIITLTKQLTGGSKLTARLAKKYYKPLLHVTFPSRNNAAEQLKEFVRQNKIKLLNVAGPRASTEPHIGKFVTEILDQTFKS